MKTDIDKVLRDLADDAGYFRVAYTGEGNVEIERPDNLTLSDNMTLAAAMLAAFRDTLVNIAQGRNHAPELGARDALMIAGVCSHEAQLFTARPGPTGGYWTCFVCKKTHPGKDRLGLFE